MDKLTLEPILLSRSNRQFWIKPIGDPGKAPDLLSVYKTDRIRVDFAKSPNGIEIGDILLVYKIGVSKFVYCAECLDEPREATSAEKVREPWRERWGWSITAHNLTPQYGAKWSQYNLKPFHLVEQFNKLHPDKRQTLGSLKFGSDKLKISSLFAQFVIQKIIVCE
jgi:hypothetical protein